MDQKRSSNKEHKWLLQEKYNGVASEEFEADVKRLEGGEPFAYVIGETPFLGCTIDLSYKPLIPRFETEHWLERAIYYIQGERGREAALSMLDIFSGSGCIGIALLHQFPQSHIDFAEREPDLIDQIKRNIKINNLQQRDHTVYLSDVFESIPNKQYDHIFANPPYLSSNRLENIQQSVLRHEPRTALFAEDNGLAYIKQTIRDGIDHLTEGGVLWIEIEPHHQENITALCTQNSLHVTYMKDQYKNVRVACISYKKIELRA